MFYKNLSLTAVFVFLLTPFSLFASEELAWKLLQEGKAVAIMRHAIAPHGGQGSEFTREVCQSERNLSQAGRDQAVKIGDVFRANGIMSAEIYSSSLCRCVDTGTLLGFGEPKFLPAIDSFYENFSNEPKQTVQLREWVKQAISNNGETNILVTHGYNISYLLGNNVAQGDILIIGLQSDRLVKLLQVSTSVP